MAWDTEATKQKILSAAISEFAEYGPSGTTVDRIANRAGVNKERVYSYFGNKQALFKHVLSAESDAITGSVTFDADREDPVGDYAGQVFDYHRARPELVRLLIWEGLTLPQDIPDEASRAANYRAKTAAFAVAQDAGILADDLDPGTLLFMIMGLITWWDAAPQVAQMLTGAATDLSSRRAAVVTAARRLAERS